MNRLTDAHLPVIKKMEEFEFGKVQGIGRSLVNLPRFKKRYMNWSKKGVLSLLKVKETIINNKWDSWWKKERYHNIKVTAFKPPLSASCFTKKGSSYAVIQARIPPLEGTNTAWVGVLLRKLTQLEYE